MDKIHLMASKLGLSSDAAKQPYRVILANDTTNWEELGYDKTAVNSIKGRIKTQVNPLTVNTAKGIDIVLMLPVEESTPAQKEKIRRLGSQAYGALQSNKLAKAAIVNTTQNTEAAYLAGEGLLLSAYSFLKYKTRNGNSVLKELKFDKSISKQQLSELQIIVEATYFARNLVNEPLSYLTAEQLSRELETAGKEAGFKVEVFNKKKIESLKMGGLLAVNRGSVEPPTFNILEWKPSNATNKQPLVLVGKGVVYDTGGLSLKPTPNSMDMMKSDMGGAAAVAGAIHAAAKAKLPVHIIGLIPATENRPGGNAYAPGDVVKMYTGLNVEVLNTDAEGRMILADALGYAAKYKPQLVIDLATLTGSAARAIGNQGVVFMGTADENTKLSLSNSGYNVHERLVEFPMWDEYDDQIRSDIADIKNIGGASAGATTAGMFLKNFVSYPWLHIDIAGMAFLDRNDGYRLKNGTGVGVRLLFDFIKKLA